MRGTFKYGAWPLDNRIADEEEVKSRNRYLTYIHVVS